MNDRRPTRVVIADEQTLFRAGLHSVLQSEPGFQLVGEVADGPEAVSAVQQLEPDILLLDLAIPRMSSLEVLRKIAALSSHCRVVLLTSTKESPQVTEALRLGARGVVMRTVAPRVLFDSFRAVVGGKYWLGSRAVTQHTKPLGQLPAAPSEPTTKMFGLTRRELQVASVVAAGCSNKEVAHELALSEDTVKNHLSDSFDKLGLSSRVELTLFAISHGLNDQKPAAQR